MIAEFDDDGQKEVEFDIDYFIKHNRARLTTPIFAFI